MDIDLQKVQITWMQDILYRINQVALSSTYNSEEKIRAIQWLVKQAMKANDND